MNLELTDLEVGLMWEALNDYAASCSAKDEQKAKKLVVIRDRIEKLCGDNS